ncbi:hypothetical protein Tco_1022119, partial [Tanacetum coccineum]
MIAKGTKKYRGSNSSDGGNTRDGVKITGGVIGYGGGIESFEELKEVLPDEAEEKVVAPSQFKECSGTEDINGKRKVWIDVEELGCEVERLGVAKRCCLGLVVSRVEEETNRSIWSLGDQVGSLNT